MRQSIFLILLFLTTTLSAHTSDATIPILDLEEFHAPDTREKFLKELEAALHDVGFFALINTSVDPEVLDKGYAATERFFAQNLEEKMKICNPAFNGQRGYVLSESAKGEKHKDFKEFLHIGRELPPSKLNEVKGYPNLWPQTFDLKGPMISLYKALDEEMQSLQEAFALLVGKPADYFSKMTREGNCLLRSVHYPATPPKGHIWAAEHTDIDLFTILPRATAQGLQVKNSEGQWIDVKVPDGAFIINAGDMLENVSNGLFRSAVHRVVDGGRNEERYSIVFYVHARGRDDLSPLEYCIQKTGGRQRYAHGTEWELLCERLADLGLASHQMIEDLGTSGFLERQIALGRESVEAMEAVQRAGYASPAVKKRLKELTRPEIVDSK